MGTFSTLGIGLPPTSAHRTEKFPRIPIRILKRRHLLTTALALPVLASLPSSGRKRTPLGGDVALQKLTHTLAELKVAISKMRVAAWAKQRGVCFSDAWNTHEMIRMHLPGREDKTMCMMRALCG